MATFNTQTISTNDDTFDLSDYFRNDGDDERACQEMQDELGLNHLRIGDIGCLQFFSPVAETIRNGKGFTVSDLLALKCSDDWTNYAGTRVWVEHSLTNREPGIAEIKGDTVRDVILAIDEALDSHLTEEERNGGRSCFLEEIFVGVGTPIELVGGEDDLLIGLGS